MRKWLICVGMFVAIFIAGARPVSANSESYAFCSFLREGMVIKNFGELMDFSGSIKISGHLRCGLDAARVLGFDIDLGRILGRNTEIEIDRSSVAVEKNKKSWRLILRGNRRSGFAGVELRW